MSENMKLSPPWVTYYRKIKALFGDDPDIEVQFDEDDNVIELYVNGQDKAEAIEQILPTEKTFGNVAVYIEVIPANKVPTNVDLFMKAFAGNPAFSFAATIDGVLTNPLTYFVFRNKVVQFFNDNLHDVNGNMSTLYQDIADEIFENRDGICFCTDTPENLGRPLGEWP